MEHFVVTQISHHGYLAVLLLMVLESACIPIPSEAIMLFGGALAGGLTLAGVHVQLDVYLVALAGAGGNLIGSLIAYAVGRWGGRALLERWGGGSCSDPTTWTGPRPSSPGAGTWPC